MDRSEYLKLCQKYAVAKEKHPDLLVVYKGLKYFPKEYLMQFDEYGNPKNIAILKDVDANSIIQVDLGKVGKYGN